MKLVRPVLFAVAATALVAAAVFACGGKSSKTSATTAAASAQAPACCAAKGRNATAASAGATCTPEMAAQCAAGKGMKGAAMAECPAMKGASMAGCPAHKGMSATTASMAGGGCTGRAMMGAMAMAHGDCSACDDMAMCDEQLTAAGARLQVVPLKNGVMYVYTSDSPARVKAVQSAVALRNRRVTSLLAAGDNAKLCPSCKQIRGAMASGKMNREVVNVESGALTLVTSNDKAMVSKILEAANTNLAVRTTH